MRPHRHMEIQQNPGKSHGRHHQQRNNPRLQFPPQGNDPADEHS